MSDCLILVPARYESSRFPGKPLAKIRSKTMVRYVCENCEESGFDYAIVTDDDRIESEVQSFGGSCVRVDDPVSTGSERIALAYERFFKEKDYKFIINVQGDEPLLKADIIKEIADLHASTHFDILTAVKERSSLEEDFKNPNVVKALYSPLTKQCLSFSRQSVPYSKEENHPWYQHIGVYSYRTKALEEFNSFPSSPFESLERLEQLRALENGLSIGALLTQINLIGVDTPEDIHKIERAL